MQSSFNRLCRLYRDKDFEGQAISVPNVSGSGIRGLSVDKGSISNPYITICGDNLLNLNIGMSTSSATVVDKKSNEITVSWSNVAVDTPSFVDTIWVNVKKGFYTVNFETEAIELLGQSQSALNYVNIAVSVDGVESSTKYSNIKNSKIIYLDEGFVKVRFVTKGTNNTINVTGVTRFYNTALIGTDEHTVKRFVPFDGITLSVPTISDMSVLKSVIPVTNVLVSATKLPGVSSSHLIKTTLQTKG